MSFAHTGKAAATTSTTGLSVTDDGDSTLAAAANLQADFEFYIQKSGADDSTLDTETMRITAVYTRNSVKEPVNIRTASGNAYRAYQDIAISNYTGTRYGIKPTVWEFDTPADSPSNPDDDLTITCTVVGVDPNISGSHSIVVTNTP